MKHAPTVDIPPPLTLDEIVDRLYELACQRRAVAARRRRAKGIDASDDGPLAREDVKFVYEAAIELLIRETIERGMVRFPGGWGGLHLKILNPRSTPRKIPSGEVVPGEPRPAIRYREGLAVRTMLGKLSPFEQETLRRQSKRKSKLNPRDF